MKRILLPLIFFLPFLSNAQNDWAPVGAKWWYESMDVALSGPPPYAVWPEKTEALSDTVINGKLCKAIGVRGCTFFDNFNGGYIYSDSNRVYYYNYENAVFYKLYDMNLNPGESWVIYYNSLWDSHFDSMLVNVVDTFSTDVNGVFLKTQQIEVVYDGTLYWGINEKIIDIIGNTYSFFPIDMGACDSGLGNLRCYQDSVLGLYHYSTNDCEFTDVGINESQISQLEIFPNPAHDFLYLKNTSQKLNYKILDYTGRVILSGKTEKEINVQTLSPGYYRVVFEDEVSRAFLKM